MRRLLTFTTLGAVLALGNPALAQKKEIVVATSQTDAGKLDPHQASAGADKGILNWVFNALVRIKPGQASPEFIEPDLAESWTSNPNGHSRSAPASSATAITASSPRRTQPSP